MYREIFHRFKGLMSSEIPRHPSFGRVGCFGGIESMAGFTMAGLPEGGPRQRFCALIVFSWLLLAFQYCSVEPHFPPSTVKGLWFYAGIASLLLGSRLLNPYFTPPGDAAVNAFVSS